MVIGFRTGKRNCRNMSKQCWRLRTPEFWTRVCLSAEVYVNIYGAVKSAEQRMNEGNCSWRTEMSLSLSVDCCSQGRRHGCTCSPRLCQEAFLRLTHIRSHGYGASSSGMKLAASLYSVLFDRPLQVTVRPMLRNRSPVRPVCLICNVGVLWPNGWMDQDATWYGDRPRPRRHCIRWDPTLPTERGTATPHFSGHAYCGQTVAHLSNC